MAPKAGDVEANLAQAEQLIGEVISRGAEWVLLPEMFTSAAAFHPDMAKAIRPLDRALAQLRRNTAHKGNAVVGGSFLAQDGDQVYDAFLLADPDGTTDRHDKDFPIYWETCY
ncbi:MAG: Nitrilase/cyanide hydratase and apolipoprotein N-acyltransferase [candidate division NC10 bacterium]|jgi:predicted amidohydrolase|nr:Nitrilase/cyanide hydratase and apolipoprotein N-acyltransferase [candidate division NC10 bacterium]